MHQNATPVRIPIGGLSGRGSPPYLRILAELVGHSNVSSVTLHQLSDDKHASANLYGKALNIAADLCHPVMFGI